jgi:hypothetical protein
MMRPPDHEFMVVLPVSEKSTSRGDMTGNASSRNLRTKKILMVLKFVWGWEVMCVVSSYGLRG